MLKKLEARLLKLADLYMNLLIDLDADPNNRRNQLRLKATRILMIQIETKIEHYHNGLSPEEAERN